MSDAVPTEERSAYIDGLADYLAERRITVEVCLTSNLQTSPNLKDIRDHSLGRMLDRRLSLSFCTDNRLISHTTISRELRLALDHFDIPPGRLKDIIAYGFKRSFFPGPYVKKRRYVRRILDFYESVEKRFGIS